MFPGESVSFSCHIDVSTGWEYLFYQNRKPLNASGNKYPISSVGITHLGSYTCEAKRGSGQNYFTIVSQAIGLEVKGMISSQNVFILLFQALEEFSSCDTAVVAPG